MASSEAVNGNQSPIGFALGSQNFHRCSVLLTKTQKEAVLQTSWILKAWFGNGQSVPLKDSVLAAQKSFDKSGSSEPAHVALFFKMPLTTFHEWIDAGTMWRVPHIEGYRVSVDIDLNLVDPQYTLHPIMSPYE